MRYSNIQLVAMSVEELPTTSGTWNKMSHAACTPHTGTRLV